MVPLRKRSLLNKFWLMIKAPQRLIVLYFSP